jgi:CheY-like chemotaxis protein
MDQHNPPPENKEKHSLVHLLVGFLGFEVVDQDKLTRAIHIERTDGRKYIAADSSSKTASDIILVNYDNPKALEEKDLILSIHPQTQVVAVSRGPLDDPPILHIRGMLIAARVLSVIDKASVGPRSESPLIQLPVSTETTLPQQVQTTAKEIDETKSSTTSANEAGYKVLVVDDSPAIQKSIEINLATLPQISLIDFADSGESAIAKAENQKYDLIFLDIMMPGMDGYEACSLLRKKPEYKKTPIIMVSGKTSPLDEVKGIVAGCTTYLTKPVQADEFKKLSIRVLTWLENKKNP